MSAADRREGHGTLQRHLGTGGATMLGLAAMIGAGVFFVWVPAAAAAGSGLLVGLVLAGLVASLNALSSAQLSMSHPVSGGAYAFGRATLGAWWGFSAGWLFLAGKTASAGAIASILGGYLWPEQARPVAVLAILVLGAVNLAGIRSTARLSAVVVFLVLGGLLVLVIVVAAGLARGSLNASFDTGSLLEGGGAGILQSAGLIFFAFAGYARMATLGEEVRAPRRTLPRAILTALGLTLAVYGVIGLLCVVVLGPAGLAASVSPLADLVGGAEPWTGIVRVLATIACLGSLSGILAGLSRTGLAMAREGDLPGALSRISPGRHSPVTAEVAIGLVAVLGVLVLDPAQLVGFSACAVLVYYAIAHLAALRQPSEQRWLARWVQYAGVAGCLLLAATLPWPGVVAASAWLAVGLLGRALRLALAARRP
ncbi:APC family permease [Cryobacterium adonitolivorans]|uniref:APC family permease n=1 Tax=Cryobacterium adonitolivorans TaxID=1259189 RepID=A0A4R8WDX6_9MICO|nr:APC family permease [Cryobacterium adonitolivorans]TFC05924.1 APC family permease [Cryobacterium adonitolivorans]